MTTRFLPERVRSTPSVEDAAAEILRVVARSLRCLVLLEYLFAVGEKWFPRWFCWFSRRMEEEDDDGDDVDATAENREDDAKEEDAQDNMVAMRTL